MSQFYVGVSSGSLPPSVATSYPTDSGTAVPAANILNVLSGTSTTDNDHRLLTTGSGNTITIETTNQIIGSVTTVGPVDDIALTFALGASGATYLFDCDVVAYNASTPAGAGFNIFGTMRTNGTTSVLVGTPDKFVNTDPALSTADANVIAAASNELTVTVVGVLGLTIDWKVFVRYTKVS